jgi:hypothetical protein
MVARRLDDTLGRWTVAALPLSLAVWAATILILPTSPASRPPGEPSPSACAKSMVSKASANCGRRPRYNGSALAIPQISPAIRRARTLRLDESACPLCAPSENGNGHSLIQKNGRPDLIDSLLQPPSASTIGVLREYDIPIIPDVPPIVILQQRRNHELRDPIGARMDR